MFFLGATFCEGSVAEGISRDSRIIAARASIAEDMTVGAGECRGSDHFGHGQLKSSQFDPAPGRAGNSRAQRQLVDRALGLYFWIYLMAEHPAAGVPFWVFGRRTRRGISRYWGGRIGNGTPDEMRIAEVAPLSATALIRKKSRSPGLRRWDAVIQKLDPDGRGQQDDGAKENPIAVF